MEQQTVERTDVRQPPAPDSAGPPRLLGVLERYGVLLVFLVLIALFSVLEPDTFPRLDNARSIMLNQAVVAVAALAVIVPLTAGRFDVSVGANLGLCSIAAAGLMANAGMPLSVAVLGALALGGLIGALNGAIVAYVGVNSFIVTIGTSTVIAGVVQWWTDGIPISGGLSPDLTALGVREVLGVPMLFAIMVVIAIGVWHFLRQTPEGRRLTAIGSNDQAAHLVGIRVQRVVMRSFVISGLLAGAGGVLLIAQLGNGNPQVGGINFILPALAAAFLGATVFQPGRYNVPGTILGLLFVAVTVSGLSLMGAPPWVEPVINGSLVVIAVSMSQVVRRARTGERVVGA